MFNTMFVYNDMLGDMAITNREDTEFMHDFFSYFVIGNEKA